MNTSKNLHEAVWLMAAIGAILLLMRLFPSLVPIFAYFAFIITVAAGVIIPIALREKKKNGNGGHA